MLAQWSRQEIALLVREPLAVFFSLAFPLVIYFFIGAPYADELVKPNVRFIDVMFPSLVGAVAANLMLMGMPVYFAELRSRGVDRRYKVMPLPGWVFGVAIVVAMCVLLLPAAAIIVTIVAVLHGLLPAVVSPLYVSINILLFTWLCLVGYFLGALPFGTRTTQAVSGALFFIMFFGSGAAAPLEGLPPWLQSITEFNPLRHWFDWLTAVYTETELPPETAWKSLLVIPCAAVLALLGLRNSKRVES
ncbi:ABC transporter permease [uncultured Leifsonia sp.]|uniref:ABC transporter permease n=1 Tax=uncultured Leifsonia sp. TaxID=340359 RepID=UPI0028D74FE0|nr:ABC transporter permease [uncultured Leifsonia sp.]